MSENNVEKFNLTFIRHGETDLNLKGVLQGHVDAELNDTGKQQAIGIGRHLQNESFSHIYSSDLSRAFQTCVHTLQQNKHAVSQVESQNELNHVEDLITVNAMLRERKFGCMEGKHWHELYRAERQSDVTEGEDFVPEGAESVNDVRIRAKGFFMYEIYANPFTKKLIQS
uniref:Uncharacterized protein n=1 Tax=Ciona savignyi TaxID=51511 RepID=H2YWV2_CIOSA